MNIAPVGDPPITVDNLQIAQFVYLLLSSRRIREVIDTVSRKVVLILGRFTPARKAILDAVREKLRYMNYVPIVFDFEKPQSRDFTETVSTLAHLARFILVDLTDPRSVPHELQAVIPTLSVPVQPLIEQSDQPYGMFGDFAKYPWVLPTFEYRDSRELLESLEARVIGLAEDKARQLRG